MMLLYFLGGCCHLFRLLLFKENPDAISSILTLALNDAVTYDKVLKNSYLVKFTWMLLKSSALFSAREARAVLMYL